jgi:hypothetical protein
VVGLLAFTGSSLACALATGAGSLLVGRAAQGVGAALLSPAALAVLLANVSSDVRGKALAVWGSLSAVGTALGVSLGGALASTLGWEWIFAINVPIGLLILIGLPAVTVAAPASPARLDAPGALLATAGTAAVVYGLVHAGSAGWAAQSTLIALASGVLLWCVFAAVEARVDQPMLRIGLLAEAPVAAGAFLMIVGTGLMVGNFFLGSFALQRAFGDSSLLVGVEFLPVAVAVGFGAHLAGHLLTRVPARWTAVAGLALAAVGEGTAAIAHDQRAGLVLGLSLAALGIGAVFVTAFTSALGAASSAEGGLRSAVVSTAHELGGAFGVAVLSTIAGAALTVPDPLPSDFTATFLAGALVAAGGAVVAALLVPAARRAPTGAYHH